MQTLMFDVKHLMRYSALTVPQPTLSEGSFLMMTISTHTAQYLLSWLWSTEKERERSGAYSCIHELARIPMSGPHLQTIQGVLITDQPNMH